MKKFFLLAAASLLAVVDVNAQLEAAKPYKELSQLPNLLQIMPAPPSFESAEFANDVVRYGWGKQQRLDPERLDMAVADAEWFDHTKVYLRWKDAFGLEINPTETPEIWKLLEASLATTDPMNHETKDFYLRQRPFERFGDDMPTDEEEKVCGRGSYLSGHCMCGWVISLVLAQVAPERANQLFIRGLEYGDSRVIVGAHWQSDIDASLTAGSIGFCALQGCEEFVAQMKKAQQEYKEKTSQTAVNSVKTAEQTATRAYRLDGTPATSTTRGVIVAGQKKFVR
ncbi:MAG: phosphatase PAP2 family protein [Prevotella sp.]|nr:phosphatase PAP2 family protein [Prevotella sp.]